MLLINGISRALLLGPGGSHTPQSPANHPSGLVGVGLGIGASLTLHPPPAHFWQRERGECCLAKGLRSGEGWGGQVREAVQ